MLPLAQWRGTTRHAIAVSHGVADARVPKNDRDAPPIRQTSGKAAHGAGLTPNISNEPTVARSGIERCGFSPRRRIHPTVCVSWPLQPLRAGQLRLRKE